MLLLLDPNANQALYEQAYRQIKEMIINGNLKADNKLPSKRSLAQENGISENTVVAAYDQLITEGYLYTKERRGYFVSPLNFQIYRQDFQDEQIARQENNLRYDLTKSIPDQSLFPYQVFQKLTNDLFREKNPNILAPSHSQGLLELRQEIQNYLRHSRGVPCQVDQIIIGPSSQYLIQMLLLLNGVSHIGIEDPGYHRYNQLFESYKRQVHPLPLDESGLSLDALKNSPAQILYMTPNHQFPTGSIMPIDRRLAILDWASKDDSRYIIEDDYDSEFKYEGLPIPPLKQLDTQDKVIYMGSFARTLAPSLRISYMVLNNQLLRKYQDKLAHLSCQVPTMTQMILANFFSQGHFERHMNTSRTFYKKKRDLLIKQITKKDVKATISGEKAGLHILLKPGHSYHSETLKRDLLEKDNIKLASLADYSLLNKDQLDNLYLSFSAVPIEEIPNLVDTIYHYIN